MQHITRSKATLNRNGTAKSYEYDMNGAALNIAVIYVNGRYPQHDFTVNKKVESLVQVVKGAGLLGLMDGTTVALKKGDQIHILQDEVYYFEGTGLELVYAATPKWTAEQTGRATNAKPVSDKY